MRGGLKCARVFGLASSVFAAHPEQSTSQAAAAPLGLSPEAGAQLGSTQLKSVEPQPTPRRVTKENKHWCFEMLCYTHTQIPNADEYIITAPPENLHQKFCSVLTVPLPSTRSTTLLPLHLLSHLADASALCPCSSPFLVSRGLHSGQSRLSQQVGPADDSFDPPLLPCCPRALPSCADCTAHTAIQPPRGP